MDQGRDPASWGDALSCAAAFGVALWCWPVPRGQLTGQSTCAPSVNPGPRLRLGRAFPADRGRSPLNAAEKVPQGQAPSRARGSP